MDDQPAGVGVYIEEMCSRLVQLNPDTVTFTGSPDARRDWLERTEIRPIGNKPGTHLTMFSGPRRRARRLRWLASDVARTLQTTGVDVLFSPVQEGPLAGRVPAAIVMHDLTALKFPHAYSRATVSQTRWLLPRMLKRAGCVIAVSNNTRRDLVDHFGLDPAIIHVVGEGFDTATFRPRSPLEVTSTAARYGAKGRYLLYAGTFSRHKNLGIVARALVELGPEFADVDFLLVGRTDTGAFDEFRCLVKRLGILPRVITAGYVTRDELAALMTGAAAFVYPSSYEGFGLAPLEAMACGAPVITSNVASLPEIIGEGGWLVDSPKARDWAETLERALAAPREVAAKAAINQAALFDWDDAAIQIQDHLTHLASAKHS